MEHAIDETKVDELLGQGLSQRAIAEQLSISRSTLRRHLKKQKGTPKETMGVPNHESQGIPVVYQKFPFAEELTDVWSELRELLTWWRERKELSARLSDTTRKRRRQTYHVEERFIEAIRRAADLERGDLADIVNRAFEHFFAERKP